VRRAFLFQLIAGCVALKASESPQDGGSIEGEWHLLSTGDDEVRVPQHRMDLRFKN
jgi:hypothetical protein